MSDLFMSEHGKRLPARKLNGSVRSVYIATGQNFLTHKTDRLECNSGGIIGDYHNGHTRKAGGREPWYERGTPIRNDRQLSLVSKAELEKIATAMGIERVAPEWIGANIVIDDIADFHTAACRSCAVFRKRSDAETGWCECTV